MIRRRTRRRGAVLALTADHGMNDKHKPDGWPDVLYLQDAFDGWYSAGRARVILPIQTLCRPSRRARLLRHGLSARQRFGIGAGGFARSRARRRRPRARQARRHGAVRVAGRSDRRSRRDLDQHKTLGTSERASRRRARRPAAFGAQRPDGTDRADGPQPQDRGIGRARAAKFRRIRCRPQPCRLNRSSSP